MPQLQETVLVHFLWLLYDELSDSDSDTVMATHVMSDEKFLLGKFVSHQQTTKFLIFEVPT